MYRTTINISMYIMMIGSMRGMYDLYYVFLDKAVRQQQYFLPVASFSGMLPTES